MAHEASNPALPELETGTAEALVQYAVWAADGIERQVENGRNHGREPNSQQLLNITGWRFFALAIAEAYELPLDRE